MGFLKTINATLGSIAVIILLAFTASCGKKNKQQEKIDFYKAQTRDTALVDSFATDTSASAMQIKYFIFNANADFKIVDVNKTDSTITESSTGYWYTSGGVLYMYIPDNENSGAIAENLANYSFDSQGRLKLAFITGQLISVNLFRT